MARKIEVQIVGDSSSLHKALGDVTARSKRFGSVLGSSLRVGSIAATAGIVGLSFATKELVESGSDMNETLNKSNVIFGKSSKGVQSWAETMAEAGGVSKQAALDSASMFGTFGKSAGVAKKDLDSWSESLVQAGSDLASFHNADPTQVLEDIRSGLAGEVEPLRKYGILMNDASLRTQALKMGLVSTTKDALSPANKMMAAQALILKSLGPAAGDFARTSGGLANQQRIMKAELQNVVSELGSALLPVILKIVTFAAPLLIGALKMITRLTEQWGPALSKASNSVGGFQNVVVSAFRKVWHWIQANIIPVVLRLRGVFQQAMQAIAKAVQSNGPELQRIFSRIGSVIKGVANVAIPILKFALVQVLPRAISIVIKVLDKLTFVIGKLADGVRWIGSHAASAFNSLKNAATRVAGVISGAMNRILGPLQSVIDKINWILSKIPDIPSPGDILHGITSTSILGGGTEQGAIFGLGGGGSQGRRNPTVVHVMLDGKVLATAMANENTQFKRQNGGRSRFA